MKIAEKGRSGTTELKTILQKFRTSFSNCIDSFAISLLSSWIESSVVDIDEVLDEAKDMAEDVAEDRAVDGAEDGAEDGAVDGAKDGAVDGVKDGSVDGADDEYMDAAEVEAEGWYKDVE